MDFDSKDAVKNALKQYVMKVHQSFKVVDSKSNKYIICCPNKSVDYPCPFYMGAILSKITDSWKVTQWGGPHTYLNMTITQDHEKLDSDLIVTCVVGIFFMFILCYFCVICYLNYFINRHDQRRSINKSFFDSRKDKQ